MLILITMLALTPAQPVAADLVLIHGKIWTGDAKQSEVAGLVVTAGRIIAVGDDAAIKPHIGTATKVIDLNGRRVVAGFHDNHVHLVGGGRSLNQVDLKDAPDEAEFGKRLKEWDVKTVKSRWLLGGNWDHDRALKGVLPTAAMVDKYVKDRPVFITRYDGHMALCNTAALRLAGIDADTKDPPGGVIERLADGKTPSGVLKDNAMDLVDKVVPAIERDEVEQSVTAALAAFVANGVTSVQDMDGSGAAARKSLHDCLLLQDMRGTLPVRVDLHHAIMEFVVGTHRYQGAAYREFGLKGFMDGSLGSSTAKMAEPYVSAKTTGVWVTEPATMKRHVLAADKEGRAVHVHAIGDEANSKLLDIFKEVAETNGPRDRRFRIEHAQHLKPADIKRFKELGVIASMQPYHVIDDGRWAEGRIGAKRCESSYAYRSLLDAGATVAFGSDWPVAPLSVMAGIDAAVNRRTLDGKHPGGWYPKERITVAEAVKAYTWAGAYSAFREKDLGTLEVGKLADFVILDTDIFDANNRDKIAATRVDATVMNGKIVFERKP